MRSIEECLSFVIRARLPAESGTLVMRALEAAQNCVPSGDSRPNAMGVAPDAVEIRRRERVDALVVMAESFLARGPAALNGGERQQIVVHVDAATLLDDAPGRCELEYGSGLAAETARRLSAIDILSQRASGRTGDRPRAAPGYG